MKQPPIPTDERERVAELRSLNILDSPPEERFDRYTRLAKRLFDVPIALVSLVDTDRQWFKSCQGLGVRQTPRAVSFCGHTVLGSDVFVIEDALADARFSDNPLVLSEPNVRFYAGCPLPGPHGHRVGTLCIFDYDRRRFGHNDIEALRDLGAMVASELVATQLATFDELTRISNRRGFDALARKTLAISARMKKSATLVMLDIDNLKTVNDVYGHDEGDRALTEFADLVLSTVRESDVVGRLGGDEFCCLLTGATEAKAEAALERLRRAVDDRNRRTDRPYPLAFSVGLAQCSSEQRKSVAELLRQADARLYRNKRAKPARPVLDASAA